MPCHDAHRLQAGAPGARVEQVEILQGPVPHEGQHEPHAAFPSVVLLSCQQHEGPVPVARGVHEGVVPDKAIAELSGVVEAERAVSQTQP